MLFTNKFNIPQSISSIFNLQFTTTIPLPKYTPQRLAIKLRPAAERHVRKQHPWVFEDSIQKQSDEGKAGDLAIIYDQKKNKLMAIGLYDPFSPIRIKVVQFKKAAKIDADWMEQKISLAFAKRTPLLETDTNSYRFIYGENDGLPGLIVDVYDKVMVIKLYSLIWLPYLIFLLPILQQKSACKTMVLRLSRLLQQHTKELQGLHDGQVLYGVLEEETVIFREHGVLFGANVIHGHKTGYFLDHRHNRKRVGEWAKGKTILDVFSYAGGFSVHALVGGATEVTSLDISAQALELARQNALLNLPKPKHKTMAIDAFEGLQQLQKKGKQFDLIIVDPPSFAKRASERDKALHSYSRLARLAIPLLAPKGILVLASCSSRIQAEEFFDLNQHALEQSGRTFEELDRTFHDIDHPIGFEEGKYLKCGYYRVD